MGDFDAHLVGISENNQRANLSPWEKAIEALRLRDHAAGIDRPHAQRDLARYLNRNVAIVNQQLAIARTITTNLIGRANLSHRDVCALPHDTLHRIVKLKPDRRGAALEEAVRAQQKPKTIARATPASEERPPLFVGPTKTLQPETRSAARKVLTRMLNELEIPP